MIHTQIVNFNTPSKIISLHYTKLWYNAFPKRIWLFSDKGESWKLGSWESCKVGTSQSPIDFNTSKMKKATYEDFTFVGYDRVTKKDNFVNNAHTVQMESTYQPQVRK